MTTVPVEFTDLTDARAGAKKVAECYGMTLKIYRLEPSGRFIVTNSKTLPSNAVFVEEHKGEPQKLPDHGAITTLAKERK